MFSVSSIFPVWLWSDHLLCLSCFTPPPLLLFPLHFSLSTPPWLVSPVSRYLVCFLRSCLFPCAPCGTLPVWLCSDLDWSPGFDPHLPCEFAFSNKSLNLTRSSWIQPNPCFTHVYIQQHKMKTETNYGLMRWRLTLCPDLCFHVYGCTFIVCMC